MTLTDIVFARLLLAEHVVVDAIIVVVEVDNGLVRAGEEAALDDQIPAVVVGADLVLAQLAEERPVADARLYLVLNEARVGPVLSLPVAPRARVVVDEEARVVRVHLRGSLGYIRLQVPDGVQFGQTVVGLHVLVVEAIGLIASHLELAHQRPNVVVDEYERLVGAFDALVANILLGASVRVHDEWSFAAAQELAEPLEELPIGVALRAVVAQIEVGRDDGGVLLVGDRAEHDRLRLERLRTVFGHLDDLLGECGGSSGRRVI